MNQQIYHGEIHPSDLSRSLIAHFSRGNYQVRQYGSKDEIVVQIATVARPTSGGQTSLNVSIQSVEDGIMVTVGKQAIFGVAASLGVSALAALKNPLSLLGRLDDIAQDIESLQLSDDIWQLIETTIRDFGASLELSEKLRRLECAYCGTANPVGEPSCVMCGAPLGSIQPTTCLHCGFVIAKDDIVCPNCGKKQ
ncbi:MAG: zinc ribbon domain-containing protein [Anaerolineaceae bacterium]|nr:zinc ribbon domain-containing protein [Anaerolineaceae bacterium]